MGLDIKICDLKMDDIENAPISKGIGTQKAVIFCLEKEAEECFARCSTTQGRSNLKLHWFKLLWKCVLTPDFLFPLYIPNPRAVDISGTCEDIYKVSHALILPVISYKYWTTQFKGKYEPFIIFVTPLWMLPTLYLCLITENRARHSIEYSHINYKQ